MPEHILDTIVTAKKAEIADARRKKPLKELIRQVADMPLSRPFFERLKKTGNDQVHIIAEIKRASPSAGTIARDLDAAEQAIRYEDGGAAAISVLTDPRFFKGCPADLEAAKRACTLPILRKDFIISTYQVYESAALGADAILLIVRILSKRQLDEYLQLAASIGLDVLVEIHTRDDLKIACRSGARLIGINNRDLSSFETDTKRALEIVRGLAPDQVPVAASGIHGRSDIKAGLKAGINSFLIGEHLVRSKDPAESIRELRGR